MQSMSNDGFVVVVNQEEQFSIWPGTRELPPGWERVDIPEEWLARYRADKHNDPQNAPALDRATCLDYIESVWADIRPLSVRTALQNSD